MPRNNIEWALMFVIIACIGYGVAAFAALMQALGQ